MTEVVRNAPNPDGAWPSRRQAWYAAIVLSITYTLAYIDRAVLGLLVEPIRADLRLSDTEIGLLGGAAFAFFYVVMGLPLGRLADRVNRRNLIASGMFIWSLMTAACGLAQTYAHLFIARMLVGVGEATLSPAAVSIIADSFPPARRQLPLAIYQSAIGVGSGLAFLVGGSVVAWVAAHPDFSLPLVGTLRAWQAVFLAVGLPGLLLLLLVLRVHEPHRQERRLASPTDVASLRSVARFIVSENGRTFAAILVAYAGFAMHSMSLALWLPAHFSRAFGWSGAQVGLTYGAILLAFAAPGMWGGAALGGWLMRRGYSDGMLRTPLVLAALMLVPAVSMTLVADSTLMLVLMIPVTLFAHGIIGVIPGILQAITPNEMRGQVGATFAFFNNVAGLVLGSTLVGVLTDYAFGDPQALGQALALTAAIVLPISLCALAIGLKHYRTSITAARSWIAP